MADGTVKELSTIGGSNYTAGSNISITGNAISVVNSPTFSGAVTAPAFYEGSLKSLKKNIKTFDKSGLDLVGDLNIVTFDRKDESAKNKIGIIADDSPKEFLSEELDAVDLYKTVFIQAKAIQELTEELHNVIWGGGGTNNNDVFAVITKLFLCKIYDEKEIRPGNKYEFQVNYIGNIVES